VGWESSILSHLLSDRTSIPHVVAQLQRPNFERWEDEVFLGVVKYGALVQEDVTKASVESFQSVVIILLLIQKYHTNIVMAPPSQLTVNLNQAHFNVSRLQSCLTVYHL
jgi:hypothetical protein